MSKASAKRSAKSAPPAPTQAARGGADDAATPQAAADGRGGPSLAQTALLIAAVWGALAIMCFFWKSYMGRADHVRLLAMLVGLGFALVACFDHLWRRYFAAPRD